MIEVFEWVFADGTVFGCGSKIEFEYWQREGIVDPDATLGKAICTEPQSEDERRKAMWGLADWHDKALA